jgi:hypothetical protein
MTISHRHSTSHSRVQSGPEGWLLVERPRLSAEAAEQPAPPATPDKKKKKQEKEKDLTNVRSEDGRPAPLAYRSHLLQVRLRKGGLFLSLKLEKTGRLYLIANQGQTVRFFLLLLDK